MRPLRSIESLYVELVPDEKNAPQLQKRSPSSAGLPGQDPSSTSLPNDGRRQSEPQLPKRERRHQIPGLRRTPYLKLYLLRCDDTDVYKSTSRKLLREWIKSLTQASQGSGSSSSQENHDAFEWMIIHVVLPDVQNSAVWPSKVSSNVLDKIRSDFNGSSKGTVDRVAQVPATKDLQVQGITVSGIPSGPAREPFLQESNRAWEDLMSKFKSLILTSFDLRVRQYEDDIKEKGSQRSLPGWNFCTFFMLKEGLSRGFESVGLVEDALMGYDELSVELLSALRDQVEKAATGQDASLFREHTQELLIQAEAAWNGTEISPNRPNYRRLSSSLLDTDKKPYRELILANNISAFDFRSYVFGRQICILLRIASLSAQSSSSTTASSGNLESLDPSVLTEICRRATSFIASLGRTIRQDLRASFKAEIDATESTLAERHNVIENMVSSWTYTSAMQMISRTYEQSISKLLRPISRSPTPTISSPPPNESLSPTSPDGSSPVSPFPKRTNSLANRLSTLTLPQKDIVSHEEFTITSPRNTQTNPAVSQLAAQRAVLYLSARRALSAVASRIGCQTGWSIEDGGDSAESLDEISLDGPQTSAIRESGGEKRYTPKPLSGVLDDTMLKSLSSERSFYSAYEVRSVQLDV